MRFSGAAADVYRDFVRWPEPLEVLPGGESFWSVGRIEHCAWLFILLGAVARTTRFLLRFPLWPDEGFLAASFLERDYAELMGPLEYHQVAPLLYLWVKLTFVRLFGFNEYSLRLLPYLCGIASLPIFRHVASRLLAGLAYLWAVAVFAVAYPLIRYAAEAKPYGCDMFVSLVLLALAVECIRQPRQLRWFLTLVGITPMAVGLSYPSVFIAGAASVAIAATLVAEGTWRTWAAWAAYNVVLVASFAGLLALSASAQYQSETYMLDCWAHTFPPFESVTGLAQWLAVTHASEMVGYPLGGKEGASLLTLVWCLSGIGLLVKDRRGPLLLLALLPLALNFVAASLHRYPYGGHVRFMIYLAPLVCLVAGVGAAWLWRATIGAAWRPALVVAAMGALALIAAGTMARDMAVPYKRQEYARIRDFARWFWHNQALSSEVLCLKLDLHREFSRETFEWGDSCLYLCNQRIYAPRKPGDPETVMARVTTERPLRCVHCRFPSVALDEDALRAWLVEMQSRFALTRRDVYPQSLYGGKDTFQGTYWVEVFEFVPKSTPSETPAREAAITARLEREEADRRRE